jgi:uncharacterized protein
MSRVRRWCVASLLCGACAMSAAQTEVKPPMQSGGTLVVVPAFGEVRQANDEVRITLTIEEQDKDKAAAASRVNQKMRQGLDIVKREDPQATFKTLNYYTYPVYPEDQPRPLSKPRQAVGWRVGQHLEVTTSNLSKLPTTVAAAQRVLALGNLQFGLRELKRHTAI